MNTIIPWYRQKTTWTAVIAFITALAAYLAGEIGITAVISSGFGALAVVFVRQGVEKSTYMPALKDRGDPVG